MLGYHGKRRNNFVCTLLRLQGWPGRNLFAYSKRAILSGSVDKNKWQTCLHASEVLVALPIYVKHVEYEKVREINFTSARKMKNDLDAKIENLSNVSSPDNSAKGNVSKEIPVPSKPEMDTFYAKLSKSCGKPIALSLIPVYADSYILKSRGVPTISDLFDKKYLALSYPELLKACQEVDIEITKEQILQVERYTVAQAKGNSFFRHRAGRIGASQSKAACQTNPAMPSQSLIQSICYPELIKLNTKAVIHGCQHEQEAISAYEEIMKKELINFKIEKCGLMINEEYPWLHETILLSGKNRHWKFQFKDKPSVLFSSTITVVYTQEAIL